MSRASGALDWKAAVIGVLVAPIVPAIIISYFQFGPEAYLPFLLLVGAAAYFFAFALGVPLFLILRRKGISSLVRQLPYVFVASFIVGCLFLWILESGFQSRSVNGVEIVRQGALTGSGLLLLLRDALALSGLTVLGWCVLFGVGKIGQYLRHPEVRSSGDAG